MKKYGNIANYIHTKAGVVLFQIVKSSDPDKSAYMQGFWHGLETSPSMQKELRTLGVYPIRAGPDANVARSFMVGEREVEEQQLAVITGEGATKGAVQKQINKVAHFMDKYTNTSSTKQKYPTPTHLGDDLTPHSGPVALDALLVDSDVIQILEAAYPTVTLRELAKHKKIMRKYFSDVEHGKLVIESHITGEPIFYKQEMLDEDEEEEEEAESEESDEANSDEESSNDENESEEGESSTEGGEETDDESSSDEAGQHHSEQEEAPHGQDEDDTNMDSDKNKEMN